MGNSKRGYQLFLAGAFLMSPCAPNLRQAAVLKPAWISSDFDLPDGVVIANGVVFALSNGENGMQKGGEARRLQNTHPAVLKALDAWTGKELYNSGAEYPSDCQITRF